MPSTYTTNNGIELIGNGEQSGTWGDTTNTNLELLDASLDGQVTITLSSAGTSGSPNGLPIANGTASNGRNRMVIFNDGSDLGATAYVQLTPNDSEKIMFIRNALSGSRDIIVFQGTYNASNDYVVPNGTTAVVYFDGAGTGAVAANVFNNAAFDGLQLGTSDVSVNKILDQDDMSGNDASALATQQSIKAYVDSQVGTVDTLAEILANGNATGGTDIAVGTGDDITFADSSKAVFGASSDLQIYHDGSNSRIQDAGTGNLLIRANAAVQIENTNGDNMLFANAGGSVDLYHDNSKKLATTSSGIDVTGTVTTDGLTSSNPITVSRNADNMLVFDNTGASGDWTIKVVDLDDTMRFTFGASDYYFFEGNGALNSGSSVVTRSKADARYLQLSGGELTGNLGVLGNIVLTGTVDGRDVAADGTKLDGIEAGADVTDAANVEAAGAVMAAGDTMTGALTIDVDNVASGALRINANQTNPDNNLYFAQEIFSTLSGSTATTGDRSQGGIYMDINSSATGGDTSNEHRAYGMYLDLDSTGDSDLVYGVYSDATATPSTGTTSAIVGVYGRAEDNGGAGQTTNVYGVRGVAVSDNSSSDVNSLYGGSFIAQPLSDSGPVSNAYGIVAEIDLASGGSDVLGTSYVVKADFDNNTGVAQTATTYLLYGAYQGALPTNPYGVYIASDVQNYFAGDLEIGGDVTFGDNGKAIFGAGSDLQIYHDGTTSVVADAGSGSLSLQTNGDRVTFWDTANAQYLGAFNVGGDVDLYYDGSKKFSTTSTGIDVTGTVTADGADINAGSTYSASTQTIAEFRGGDNSNSTYGAIEVGHSASQRGLKISGGRGAAVGDGYISVIDNSGTAVDAIRIQEGGDISFYEDTGTTPKLFWDASAESLGIGTSSPSQKLDVRVGSFNSAVAQFTGANDGRGLLISTFLRASNDDSVDYDTPFGGHHTFSSSGSEKVRITNTGNVGIGTTSPSGTLTVTDGDDGLEIGNEGVAGTTRIFAYDRNASSEINLIQRAASHQFQTNGTERLRITNIGNVGIGTNNPTFSTGGGIEVSHVSSANLRLNSDTGGAAEIRHGTALAIETRTAEPVIIGTNSSERMRIDSSGNVGIKTSSPSSELDVNGSITTDGLTSSNPITVSRNADNMLVFDNTGASDDWTIKVVDPDDTMRFTWGTADTYQFSPGATLSASTSVVTRGNGDARYLTLSGGTLTGATTVETRLTVGTGAAGSINGDELALSKDQTNVGMSILSADATGQSRIYFGSQTDTQAAMIRHNEVNDRLFVQAKGDLYFQTGGTNTRMTLNTSGDLDVTGALSKGSGSFKIDHPLKPDTHHLVHSFIEGPQADNIYRGRVTLVDGTATVNLDVAGRMTEGTFVALNGNVQCFTSNEDGWTAVRGSVSGNVLTIEAQDATCTDTVSWMVIGERHDQHMIDTHWTDDTGRVITEPEKATVEQN